MTRAMLLPLFALSLMLGSLNASADQPTDRHAADTRQFNQLLHKRNALTRKLHDLDRMAARELAAGREPVSLYAQQQAAQDELDHITFRLEVLAMRLGRMLPDPPSAPDSDLAKPDDAGNYNHNFKRGRTRAVALLQKQTKDLLASLDLSAYVDRQ